MIKVSSISGETQDYSIMVVSDLEKNSYNINLM